MFEIFRDILHGNIKGLNDRYLNIQKTHKDRFIGGMMMGNDHQRKMSKLGKVENAMSALFEKVNENRNVKKEIILQLELTSADLYASLQVLHRHVGAAGEIFDAKTFLYYEAAFESSLKGDTEAFRNAAVKYRLDANKVDLYLTALNAQIMQLFAYLESDLRQIRYLWDLYQKDHPQRLKEIFHAALANQISFDNEKSLRAYIDGIKGIDWLIEREVKCLR